jgi:hypothetical protein
MNIAILVLWIGLVILIAWGVKVFSSHTGSGEKSIGRKEL